MYCLDLAFAFIFGLDEDIIQIHNDEDIKLFREDFIDVALECYRSVGQSKRHYLIFEIAVSGPESSFPLISFTNSHPVIGTSEVELGKPPCSPQSIQGLLDQRKLILIFDGRVVKSLIINAKSEVAIWFFIKKDGSFFWGFGESDKTIFQFGLNVSFQSLQFYWP